MNHATKQEPNTERDLLWEQQQTTNKQQQSNTS